jgi:hypothetical protein
MKTHKNACLTPKDRDAMIRAFVAGGLTKAVAPRQCHTMPKTIGKWVDRFLTQWLPRKRRFVAITTNDSQQVAGKEPPRRARIARRCRQH